MSKRRVSKSVLDEDVSEADLALARRWLIADKAWEERVRREPYDGVIGLVPDWFPQPISAEFERVRFNLLRSSVAGEEVTPELVRLWVDRYKALGEGDKDDYIPREFFEQVSRLANWRWIASLGPKRGTLELGVPDAAEVARAKKFDHPRRKGALDDLGKLMVSIARERPQISNQEMWSELANSATRARLLPGIIQEVDDDRIYYRSRGKDKSVSWSGFRSRMSRVRKQLK